MSLPAQIPPQSVESEQAVIGSILLNKDAAAIAFGLLRPESFYSAKHERIFRAASELFDDGDPIDILTVTEKLKTQDKLDEVGGAYYVTELGSRRVQSKNVEYYCRIVQEKALLRDLITATASAQQAAYDPAADAFEVLDEVEAALLSVSQMTMRRGAEHVSPVLKRVIGKIEQATNSDGGVTGVPSGLHRLDSITGGWQRSDLVIVAARPSMGKTALALAFAQTASSLKTPVPVGIFSLEMSAEQLVQRLLIMKSRVDGHGARTGTLREDDWPVLMRAAARLDGQPIYIDDSAGLTVTELRAKARRMKTEFDIGLLIVDYLQLMHGGSRGRSNREQEISHISRSLKQIAKELDIPVIALSQLSRNVEQRGGDRRPMLSDLRESGSIEQDADVVIFVYRAERYGINVDEHGNSTIGVAELMVSKQRNGRVGTATVAFVEQHANFENKSTMYADSGWSPPSREPEPSHHEPRSFFDEDSPF